jgi:hypothetical protein
LFERFLVAETVPQYAAMNADERRGGVMTSKLVVKKPPRGTSGATFEHKPVLVPKMASHLAARQFDSTSRAP